MPLTIETVAKLARLEVKVEILDKKVDHIDFCVDDLKRTIWKASGALTLVMFAVGWLFK